MRVPARIIEALTFVGEHNDDDDWMVVKRTVLLCIPSNMRKLFSTRDPKTKRQSLNEFECHLIDIYERQTGVRLVLKGVDDVC